MGWLTLSGTTKQQIIQHVIQFEENAQCRWETIRYAVRGNIVWVVVQYLDKLNQIPDRFIVCYLLRADGDGWGYKSIHEDSGPCYYSCPVSFLKLVPITCKIWRDEVYRYHERQCRCYNFGDVLILRYSIIPQVTVDQLKPLIGHFKGIRYRIKRQHVERVISAGSPSDAV